MIRISRQTDYGILLLTHMVSRADGVTYSARELAEETGVPLPTVSKILKLLLHDGLLVSHRGVKGGYELAKEPEEITLADVVNAMDGPIAMTLCVSAPGDCLHESQCRVRTNWHKINQAILQALESVTLSDMAQPLADSLVSIGSPGSRTAGRAGLEL